MDSAEKALRRAAYMLSRRSYSRQELYDKLLAKEVSGKDAAFCVKRLTELNVLDDEAYAKAVADNYSGRGYGIFRVRQELKKRGIADETVDELLDAPPDPEEKICALIREKLRGKMPDRKELKRLNDYLSRRGFSYGEIASAFRKLLSVDEFID
jgi:regulatory protein